MSRYHVHVYRLAGLCEVELTAASPTEAMELAIREARSPNSPAWQEPDNQYMALPFDLSEVSLGYTPSVPSAVPSPAKPDVVYLEATVSDPVGIKVIPDPNDESHQSSINASAKGPSPLGDGGIAADTY